MFVRRKFLTPCITKAEYTGNNSGVRWKTEGGLKSEAPESELQGSDYLCCLLVVVTVVVVCFH